MELNKKIKESFEQQRPKAPKGLWDKLADQLDNEQVTNGLDKKIKESFEQEAPKAPKGLWAGLSSQLEQQNEFSLDKKVRESFQQQDLKTPKQVWEKTNRQLTLEAVWKRVSAALDEEPIVSNWIGRMIRFGAVAVVLLLFTKSCIHTTLDHNYQQLTEKLILDSYQTKVKTVAGTVSATSTKNNTETANSINTEQEIQPKSPLVNKLLKIKKSQYEQPISTTAESNTNSTTNNKTNPVSQKDKQQAIAKDSAKKLHSKPITNEEATTKTTILADIAKESSKQTQKTLTTNIDELLAMAILDSITPQTDGIVTEEIVLLAPNEKYNKNINKKWELGIVYNLQSTLFLNPETQESFDRNSLSSTSITPSNSYGLTLNYRLTQKHSLSLEWFLNAEAKQNYGLYLQGRYYIRKVKLNYSKIALNHKFYLHQIKGKMPSSTYLKTGGYLAILTHQQNKYLNQNDFFESTEKQHSNWDTGIRIGLGQDLRFGRVLVGLGIQAELGLANIFSGNQYIPASFNRTNIFSIGGMLSIRYLL